MIFIFCLAGTAKPQNRCASIFAKNSSSISNVQSLVDHRLDFVMTDFTGLALPLRSNGCGAVCAVNVSEAVRIQAGFPPKSKSELSETVYQLTRSQLISTTFGYHASKSIQGLNVGSLAKLLDQLLKTESPVDYELDSFYVLLGRNDLAHEGNIHFVNTIDSAAFSVNVSTFKIILVSVNDKNRLSDGNSFLTSHFYTVLSHKDGIVTLHDPNLKGSQIQFKAIQDTDTATGITTFILEPMTPSYTIDPSFPRDLLYVVSGYVSLNTH